MDPFIKAVLVCIFLGVLFCIAPMVTLWTINSLAKAGGANFYIPHTAWNYLLTVILLFIVRGDVEIKR